MNQRAAVFGCAILSVFFAACTTSIARESTSQLEMNRPNFIYGRIERAERRKSDYRKQEPAKDLQTPVQEKSTGESKTEYRILTGDTVVETRELSIAWDSWRNKFNRSVWKKLNQKLLGGDAIIMGPICIKWAGRPIPHFEKGLRAEFECQVHANRTITNLHLVSKSGNTQFDQILLESVQEVNKSRLQFPEGSQRQFVEMGCAFKIGNGQFHETKYGDVEKVTYASNQDMNTND